MCPLTYYGDDTASVRYCHPLSSDCTYGYGDDYLKKCMAICTGPSPVDTFGSGNDCVSCKYLYYLSLSKWYIC